jgi:hypothetical protein
MRVSIHVDMADHFGSLGWFQPRFVHYGSSILHKACAQRLVLRQANQ